MSDVPDWREPTADEERHAPQVNGHTFWEALCFARGSVEPTGEGADPGPLADYIAAKPLTRNQQLMLADLLRMLPALLPRGQRGAGLHKSTQTAAEKDVARRIAAKQIEWLALNPTQAGKPRKRVAASLTDQWIAVEINKQDSPWHSESAQHRDMVLRNVQRHLKNKSRLSK